MRLGLGLACGATAGLSSPPPPGPVVVTPPSVGGTPAVGETLTLSPGVWSGTGPITLARQWLRDGEAVAGRTGTTYPVGAADAGRVLSCLVTASDAAGSRSIVTAGLPVPAAAGQIVRYHVVGGFGQSNMHGAAAPSLYDPLIDTTDPRILLLKDNPGQPDHDTLVVASDPLCADAEGTPPQVGLMMPYAREMLAGLPADEAIILVIEAHGGSGFAGNRWEAGGAYRERSAQRLNTALAMVPPGGTQSAGNTVQVAWQQGENSVMRGLSQAEHAAELDSLLAFWRSETGVPDLPVTLGEPSQGFQDSAPVEAPPVVAAIADTPNRVPHTAHVTSRWIDGSGDLPGNLHFTTPAYRELGRKHAQALPVARANTGAMTGAPVSITAPAIAGTLQDGQTLTVSDGVWANLPTALARQWTRDGIAIAGATGAAHALGAADVGTVIGCTVTATNAAGSLSVPATGGGTVSASVAYPAGIAAIGQGAWYDFSDPATVTVAGDTLETAADLSGNGRTLIGSATTPPVYTAATTIAGRRAIDLVSDTMGCATLHPVFAGAAWSLTSYAEVDTSKTALIFGADGPVDYVWLGYRNNGTLRVYSSVGSSDLAPSSPLAEALTWNFDGSALTLWRGGVQIGTPLALALGGMALSSATVSGNSAGNFKLTGRIGELIAVPRNLSAQEIGDLHGYLAQKWAV